MASRSDYGANPNAGVNVNADHGWGGYQWPAGVPSNLLGTTNYQQRNGAKQLIRVTVRKELVSLFELAAELADVKHGYQIWANRAGEVWGPWSYENRAIGGTSTASNHSRAKAWDVNAPNNPQSYTFQSDLPPGLVEDWERIGLCWGGRYGSPTKFDTMHFEYGYSPADVAGHVALARQLLGGGSTPITPSPSPEEDDTMQVRRDNQTKIDYAFDARNFIRITDPNHFGLLKSAGFIAVDHEQAPEINTWDVEWIRGQVLAWGGRADDYVAPGKA